MNEIKNEIKKQGYMTYCNIAMLSSPFSNFIKEENKNEQLKDIPSLDYEQNIFSINGSLFYEAIKLFKKLKYESFFIIKEKYFLIFKNKDNDNLNEIVFKIPLLDNGFNNEDNFKALYSTDYLNTFLSNFNKSALNTEIVLNFKEDYPLKLQINNEWIILAPRIDNN